MFFITRMTNDNPIGKNENGINTYRTNVVCFLEDFEDAYNTVLEHPWDLHETKYNYLVIEEWKPGRLDDNLKKEKAWFKYFDELGRWEEIPKPSGLQRFMNFAMSGV